MTTTKAELVGKYLQNDLIFLQQSLETTDQVFELVNKEAMKDDLVTDNFLTKIKKREATYPTGLQLEHDGVAIPHTDADTIKHEFIAVLVNKNGIPFKRMDDAHITVKAHVIFVLGLNNPHAQLTMLQNLMEIIQDNEFMDKLKQTSSKEAVFKLFDTKMK